jgi:elongation factor Ts
MDHDPATESLQYYIHTGSRLGVLVKFSGALKDSSFEQLTKDIAMHIASFGPEFVDRSEIDQNIIAEETRIEMGKEDLKNKPEAIREKIVEGRVSKLLSGRCLVDQMFAKDQSKTVQQVLDEYNKQNNSNVRVVEFKRLAL